MLDEYLVFLDEAGDPCSQDLAYQARKVGVDDRGEVRYEIRVPFELPNQPTPPTNMPSPQDLARQNRATNLIKNIRQELRSIEKQTIKSAHEHPLVLELGEDGITQAPCDGSDNANKS